MPQATGNTVTTTGTGASDYIRLRPDGMYAVVVTWAGSAGDADLEVGDGSNFVTAEDATGAVNITSGKAVTVVGGMCYRLNVTTHTTAATMTFHNISSGD